jgi:ubiquinone/menaquinone biosynthesis C-methylase UbiE
LPSRDFNPKQFWHDYLLGRDGHLGIELMTTALAYRELMDHQLELLALADKLVIADLGAGLGDLSVAIQKRGLDVSVVAMDLVYDALVRGRRRTKNGRPLVHALVADLSPSRALPLRDCSVDRVLASLLLSYVNSPDKVLKEAFRVLRPGGWLVVSSLRKDADISRLFTDGLHEHRARLGRSGGIEDDARSFLNDAARLLDLEEWGMFHFWDEREIRSLVEQAGFRTRTVTQSFGRPPQAFVVAARRP